MAWLIPWALCAYFWARAVQLPLPLVWTVIAVVVALKWGTRQPHRAEPASRSLPINAAEGWQLLIAGVLIAGTALVGLAPTLRVAMQLATGPWPTGFLSADESYNFMLARALERSFPPPDLGYAGRLSSYHLGGPLLSEMLSRTGLISLHMAFFGVWPALLKVVALGCVWTALGRLAPRADLRLRALGCLAASGLFTVDVYNVVWNARNAIKLGTLDWNTISGGMPAFTTYGGWITEEFHYAAPLACIFAAVLMLVQHRLNAVVQAGILFAIFLAKASVWVPVGLVWGLWAVFAAWRHRNWQPMTAGALALVMCLLARNYVMEPLGLRMMPGIGFGLTWLSGLGWNVAQLMGVSSPPAHGIAHWSWPAVLCGIVLLAVGTHVYGWAIWGALKSWSDTDLSRQSSKPEKQPFGLPQWMLATIAVASLFCCVIVFHLPLSYRAAFDAVHAAVAHSLWRDAATYIDELWKLSVAEARILVRYGFAWLAVGAVLQLLATTQIRPNARSAWFRRCLFIALATSVLIAVAQSALTLREPVSSRFKAITPDTAQALQSIPSGSSLLLTNECAYDQTVERHMPLMNAAMSAYQGHAFWICNLMFNNNFAAADATARLEKWRWFWSAEPGLDHEALVRSAGITHLLVDRRLPDGEKFAESLVAITWTRTILSNKTYVVLEVLPPHR